ncbi:dihydrofolate reductase family protein [Balneola vulgaris]|uniref:dihydrofolate reductase family protein n=1 Tax=Balneola vulgaris TaxID=287535 RepID=UPI0003654508|nr:dihydrofolate reductase family protein [Balneola vulgaris]
MKCSVYIAVSVDGYIARKDGSLDWLPGADPNEQSNTPAEDYGYHAFIQSVDALVMGRNTFEMIQSFGSWPYPMDVFVLTNRPLDKLPDGVTNIYAVQGSPSDVVEQIQQKGHQHLYIDGGDTIQQFLKANLISELILTKVPVLIGQGISLFGDSDLGKDIPLKHLSSQSYENGFVQSHYQIIST